MKKKLTEQIVLFASIIKWVALATGIGIIVGISTTFYLKILEFGERSSNYSYYFLLLPIAMFLSVLIVKYLAPNAEGHGTEKVIEAVHKNSGKIKAAVIPVKLVATVITIATGGSAGKEGPAAQIGGGLSSVFSDIFKFNNHDRKKLVICGISAGFASVFGTPIAGALFGVEVLFIGSMLYDVLLPSFISGIVAYHVSSMLGIKYFHHFIEFIPDFSGPLFLKVILAGVIFGLISFLFIEILNIGKIISKKINIWSPLKGFIGGVLIIGLVFLFSRRYLGLGVDVIHQTLEGGKVIWYDSVMKMIFTSLTLNFGGSGGIVTPIFYIGSTSGSLFAQIMNLDPAVFAAIGMVSLLAGAANTPIAASILAIELFGPSIAPYAAIACIISFFMTGHRSVYPSQVLAIKKSESIDVSLGEEIDNIKTDIKMHKTNILKKGLNSIKKKKEKGGN